MVGLAFTFFFNWLQQMFVHERHWHFQIIFRWGLSKFELGRIVQHLWSLRHFFITQSMEVIRSNIIRFINENARPVFFQPITTWDILSIEWIGTLWWISLLKKLVFLGRKRWHLLAFLLFEGKLLIIIVKYFGVFKLVYNATFSFNDIVFRATNLVEMQILKYMIIFPMRWNYFTHLWSSNWLLPELSQKTILTIGHISMINNNLF